ncbi:MltA domain-containing protein [Phycisphaeraceae bacterium D3-23]
MIARTAGMRLAAGIALLFSTLLFVGCNTPGPVGPPPPPPDYARALRPGQSALRLVNSPTERPDLTQLAAQFADPGFAESLSRSVAWYALPSSQRTFPISGISHIHARTSAQALQWILANTGDPRQAAQQIDREFDVYTSVGWDGNGGVLLTGYYSPVFSASYERAGQYQYPLYRRPNDLLTDPTTGLTFGRRNPDGTVTPYPTRAQIEQQNLLQGGELVYLPSRLDAYTIEVNGSAKLNMTDGTELLVGYDGNNGYDYTSIGRQLVADGKLDANTVSMPTIRRFFQQNPAELERYIQRNDRFIFFKEYDATDWPAGSLGFRVEGRRSLATDKEVYPPGAVVLVRTQRTNNGGPINQLMLDQDTGGAIRAPGRADLYFGIGPVAEEQAGVLAIEGRLYYLFLKRELVQGWHNRLR